MQQTLITTPNNGTAGYINGIGYTQGTWLVFVEGAGNGFFISQNDGSTWTPLGSGVDGVIYHSLGGITFSSDGATWVIDDILGNAVYSTDLATWNPLTPTPAAADAADGIYYLNGTYVTAPWTDTTIKVATSTDLSTWTTIDTGITATAVDRRAITFYDGAWFVVSTTGTYRGTSLTGLTLTTGSFTASSASLFGNATGLYQQGGTDVKKWDETLGEWGASSALAGESGVYDVHLGNFVTFDYDGTLHVFDGTTWTTLDLPYYAAPAQEIEGILSSGPKMLLLGEVGANCYLYQDDQVATSTTARYAQGSMVVKHGVAVTLYHQTCAASGHLASRHGVASTFLAPASGGTFCAATGTRVTKHGAATGVSPHVGLASGKLTTKHGTAIGGRASAATGSFLTKYGAANGAVLTYARGSFNTKYGTAKNQAIGQATGKFVVRYGTGVSEAEFVGVATGQAQTRYGTASSASRFAAQPSFRTRYGVAKLVRGITC